MIYIKFIFSESLLSKVQVFLTMPTRQEDFKEFKTLFLPSILLFWPNHELNLLILLDEESANLDEFSKNLTALIPSSVRSFSIATNAPPDVKFVRNILNPALSPGWYRQQLIMFWAGNFTDFEYVGFVDTDTVFTGNVYEECLFENGKPRVLGIWGENPIRSGSLGTLWATGMPQKLYGMSYFPVVLRTSDLDLVIDYIKNRFNSGNFSECLMKSLYPNSFFPDYKEWIFPSQFDHMLNILYVLKHDEYYFQIRPCQTVNCIKNNFDNARDNTKLLPEELNRPTPFVTLHWTYKSKEGTYSEVLLTGYCYGLRSFDPNPSICNFVNTAVPNRFEWEFEYLSFYSQPGSLEAHYNRRKLVDSKFKFEHNSDVLKDVIKTFENEKLLQKNDQEQKERADFYFWFFTIAGLTFGENYHKRNE